MTLHRSGNYARAAFSALAAALFIGCQALVAYRLVTAGAWDTGLGPLLYLAAIAVVFLLIMDVAYLISPLGDVFNERRLQAAARRDPHLTPPTTVQPRRDLALRDGETLRLERVRSVWNLISSLVKTLLVVAALAVFGEVLIIALLPSLARSALNPLNELIPVGPVAPASSLAPLDWLSAALPLIVAARLLITLAPEILGSRRDLIVADDNGVTCIRAWRRRRFIPWNDILVFLRGLDTMTDAPHGGYWLWGRDHGIHLQIHTAHDSLVSAQASRKKRVGAYVFSGGYEAYERGARRLLATIAARSFQPLIYSASSSPLLARLQRRFPVATMDLPDALALPVAPAALQPPEAAVALARQEPVAPFRLAPRFIGAWFPVLAEIVGLFAVFGGNVYFCAAQFTPELTPSGIASGDLMAHIMFGVTVGLILFFCGGMAVGVALGRRQSQLPGARVTETGLSQFPGGGRSGAPDGLRWEDIRAWAALPPSPDGKRPMMVIVLGDVKKIVWVEPEHARLYGRGVQGDREAAFRERAAGLRALVAAKTGLPLRDATSFASGARGVKEGPAAGEWSSTR